MLLTSVHPKTPTLREAQPFGDTDGKRNLLINKPCDLPTWMMVLRFCLKHKTCHWIIIVLPNAS
jgi:hypothetical protein